MPEAEGEPGDGGEHAQPTQGADDAPDFLILQEQTPLAEKNRPVALVRADERQSSTARVGHVGADIGKIFKEPETGKGETGGFALPEKIDGAEQRDEQFAERSAEK